MKKLVIALFVLGMALPSFAGLKVKDVAGTIGTDGGEAPVTGAKIE
jgi:hypothetical protein